MEDFQVNIERSIENKQLMNNQTFKNGFKYMYNNGISHKLLDLFLKYLEIYPQQISLIPKNLFIHLISNTVCIGEPLHPLILFLASRHDSIDYDLDLNNLPVEHWAYIMSALYQQFPLMICDPVFVMNIKNKINTYTMLMESPKWFNENGDFFMGLHSIEFDENECNELFTKLKSDWSLFKITNVAVSFVDLVASKCNRELEFIQFLITALFSLPPKNDNITWLSTQIINSLKLLETNCLIQISDWEDLAIKAIKYGLVEENPEYGYIRVFNKLIKKVYLDKSLVSKFFELLVGYSQFSNIMLNRDAKQIQKEEVLRLIETLVKKEPSIMALSHVPLYLCSYNASLSVTDQILLRILFLYEENSIPMSDYRPYLWGSFAVSHYQVKSHLISKTLNSYPSTTEVLSYIPLKRLNQTISFFPVDRTLCIKNQKILRFNINNNKDPSQMFDPAFFLPMISSLLATEAPLSIEKFTKNGCLSMVLACLGSNDSPMRSAAYHILTLLRSHLFCRRAENMFWDHFISWVARGIQDLNIKPPPQLSMIQALFLSRMVLAIANHEKGIDETCYKILLARPAARLNHIPELKTFLTAYNKYESKEKTFHIRWFMEIIMDGIRSKNDWQILKNMDLFNIILMIFNFGNSKDRKLVLKILKATFSVQPATNGGTGPLALNFMVAVTKYSHEFCTEEVLLIFQCLQALSSSSFISVPAIDFWFYIFSEYGNNFDICSAGFVTINNIISKYQGIYQILNDDNIKEILCRGEKTNVLSSDEVFKCRSILKYGTNGIKIEEKNSYLFLPVLMKMLK